MNELSYSKAMKKAWHKTKQRLFQPFDFFVWFTLGFTAWLATLGERGFSLNFNIPGPSTQRAGSSWSPQQTLQEVSSFIAEHVLIISVVGSIAALIIITVSLIIIWINSRGKFMFIHNLIQDHAEIAIPWNLFRDQGNSLFLWRLGYTVITLGLTALFLAGGALLLLPCILQKQLLLIPGLSLFILLMVFMVYAAVLSIISCFLNDFVVPIMAHRKSRAMDAWRTFMNIFYDSFWSFIGYAILKFMLATGFFFTFTLLYFFTCCFCCIGGLLLALPYIGVVIMLPYHAFMQNFSLSFLAQFGTEYDLYQQTEDAPTAGICSPS